MTPFITGLSLIILSLCVSYRPTGWPVSVFWLGMGLVVGSIIKGPL